MPEQQKVMSSAWEYAKTHGMNPAEVLGKMNLLFVKADQLPGGGAGAVMQNGTAIISFDEARGLGIIGPGQYGPGPGMPGRPQQVPQQASGFPQRQPQAQQGQQQTPNPSTPNANMPNIPGQQGPGAPPPPMRQLSGSGRPGSRSGFPPGMMGPPATASPGPGQGPPQRRPSVAPGMMDPSAMAQAQANEAQMRRGSMHPSAGIPGAPTAPVIPQNGPPTVEAPVSLPMPLPASLSSAPVGFAPPPTAPNPNLPPVHGGALPPTTFKGIRVTGSNTCLTPLPNFGRNSLTEEDINGAVWQPLSEKEEKQMMQLMEKDSEYDQALRQQTLKMHTMLRSRLDDLHPMRRRRSQSQGTQRPEDALHWWERGDGEQGGHDGQLRIIFPEDRRANLVAKRGGRKATTSALLERLKPRQLVAVGEQPEDLVPVRLEIDHEGWKLRDTFTWNASDDVTSYDEFAHNLCEDYGLPEAGFVPLIRESLAQQIGEHIQSKALRPLHFDVDSEKAADKTGYGNMSEAEDEWWRKWRQTVQQLEDAAWGRRSQTVEMPSDDEDEAGRTLAKRSISTAAITELRIPIKLDVTVGAMNLVDTLEWDVLNDGASAEAFAKRFAVDLGLAGEFETAVAHSIREQVDVHLRSLSLSGYGFDGAPVSDDELRVAFLPEVSRDTVARVVPQDIEDYTPRLLQLNEAEIDSLERERERESKRKKRQTRGRRGVNMPDREPLKTQRTPVICGLQAAQIEAAGGAAVVAAAAAAANSHSGAGGFGPDVLTGPRSSTRRAAAAANAHMQAAALGEFEGGTPTTQTRGSEAPATAGSAKRQRLEHHAVHFRYPGGLGRAGSEGPRFAPSSGNDGSTTSRGDHRGSTDEQRKASSSMDGGLTVESANRSRASPLHDVGNVKASGVGGAGSSLTVPKGVRPEDVANLQPNFHDGQWHCANCGMPGWLTLSRRKGPLGEKTLCGPCGKFWHRFRKMKQVVYTRDEAHHRAVLLANGETPRPGSMASRLSTDDDLTNSSFPTPRTGTPQRDDDGGDGPGTAQAASARPIKQAPTRGGSPDLPFQPVGSPSDSDSDRSESPRVSRRASPSKGGRTTIVIRKSNSPMKPDGFNGDASTPAPSNPSLAVAPTATTASPNLAPPGATASPAPVSAPLPSGGGSASAQAPPEWLTQAAAELRAKYRDDRFEFKSKGPGLWRIKCLDCPGKLYTPGPEESLTNFEIHLKNRQHRANVTARLAGNAKGPSVAGSDGAASPI